MKSRAYINLSKEHYWLLIGKLPVFTKIKDAQGERLPTQWTTTIIVAYKQLFYDIDIRYLCTLSEKLA